MKPRLTFIVPAYNSAATLVETLSSLRAQKMQDWRAIVVDDGSTDATASVARGFGDPRVEIVSQENRGLAGARNTGVRHAWDDRDPQGCLVSFLDADDTIAPTYAARMLEALNAEPNADIVACAFEFMDSENRPMDWTIRPARHDASIERLIETNSFAVTCVARLARLRELATLPSPPAREQNVFDERLRVLEDWDLWLRATANGLRWATSVEQPLFRYRCSAGLSRNTELMWSTGVRVISNAPVDASLKPRALRRWALRNAGRAVAVRDLDLARRLVAEVEPLETHDLLMLAESLAPSFQREEQLGPTRIQDRGDHWRREVQAVFQGKSWLANLLAAFDATTIDWRSIARNAIESLGTGETPLVYGMGWNGRAMLAAIAEVSPETRVDWIDDHPLAEAPAIPGLHARRIASNDITPRHAVIVTPNAASQILAKLRDARVVFPKPQAA